MKLIGSLFFEKEDRKVTVIDEKSLSNGTFGILTELEAGVIELESKKNEKGISYGKNYLQLSDKIFANYPNLDIEQIKTTNNMPGFLIHINKVKYFLKLCFSGNKEDGVTQHIGTHLSEMAGANIVTSHVSMAQKSKGKGIDFSFLIQDYVPKLTPLDQKPFDEAMPYINEVIEIDTTVNNRLKSDSLWRKIFPNTEVTDFGSNNAFVKDKKLTIFDVYLRNWKSDSK